MNVDRDLGIGLTFTGLMFRLLPTLDVRLYRGILSANANLISLTLILRDTTLTIGFAFLDFFGEKSFDSFGELFLNAVDNGEERQHSGHTDEAEPEGLLQHLLAERLILDLEGEPLAVNPCTKSGSVGSAVDPMA